ncbi:MAG: succinate--CoA ligase [Actinomycetia bacterium]|nr:succinate--CoA ligase [Actinomycetes bacterium]MCP4225549.1 succinate--CoA ligase [Actinomycetes bacterium]
MKLPEHKAKALLAENGIRIPRGHVVDSAEGARAAAEDLGPAVAVKAQVASGGRGKAGGVAVVSTVEEAAAAADRILGMELAGEIVTTILIEEALDIVEEHYVSIAVDPSLGRPVIMTSDQGGVEIESMTSTIEHTVVPVWGLELTDPITATLLTAFDELDALLIEINPLAVVRDVEAGRELVALDAKIELDDAAAFRHVERFAELDEDEAAGGTEREQAAAEIGLRLIELDGDIAVLANGAGLTMATMDAIVYAGGAPANFLEIGGDAYTKATPALELVLSQPNVKSLLVNFCGAFARCDVMTAGVIEAWTALEPDVPISFSISGTGQDEARDMVRSRLNIEPYPTMAEAVVAAVGAARGEQA